MDNSSNTPSQATPELPNQYMSDTVHDLSMYPVAEEGVQRFVISLRALENEMNHKVELIAGKEMEVDCNIHRLVGDFSEETVEGWGYNYIRFNSKGNVMSTKKMCPKGSTAVKLVKGDSFMTRYNSRLPVVVYAPEGIEILYRIWSTNNEQPAKKL